ncbi:MAG TPA: hypothetical protein P5205_12955 [Candidatus Paceibacterota bacterium]|nr:hypothetical protein [Verrucomicrobiota bacterium]HSA11270.1 hypothetical protein [Candidatus Paceibacterota bacterium]
MNRTKRLKGTCTECGGPIEFPAEMIGATAQCPRCRKQTELRLSAPPEEPVVPRRVIVWTAVTIAILVLAAVALVIGLKHFEELNASQTQQAAGVEAARSTNSPAPARQ